MVQTDTLKDSQSRTIGYIETDSRGKQTARTAQHITVGYYDPRTNWTVDRNNCRVSSGNTLMALLLQG
jgi:hypothetical protein